ncbi:uncharacterized protein EAF01_004253 [Botrytis porri]|uniref:Uncharacterized protein n=1 Tax=Botrytis porri TaxID=87229 RepID=A0A4Z1KQA9_9HELO|nr:uncharacterized protein EAF01_004253 [Botrytis porri]KAF7908498.1 hypothetical protein EAF01_004253 [Botrytis porri]TGO83555.1 hypothetical protein BPOR_0628g00050 [Botrytis porri]
MSIPIIPILTPLDYEWKYISPPCYYSGTGPVVKPVTNNVSPPSNTSVGNPDISIDARLKDARLKLKLDILKCIGQSLKDPDQTEVIRLRLKFDQLQVGMAETDSRIERMRTETLRVERAELEAELTKARAELASIDAILASDEPDDGELGEDEMDENETNEDDVSGENGREENKKGENKPDEDETEGEIEDHKIGEYIKEEGEILDEMEDKKMDKYGMENHKTNQHKRDEDQRRNKDYDKKEILASSFREAIRKELDDELEKVFRKNQELDLQENMDGHSPKKRKFAYQEKQYDTSNPVPSSPDVKSGSSKIAWIDTVPLLKELNTHLAGYKLSSSAEEIMDIRSWIDKSFDSGMRRLLRNQPIADILASWDNRYEEEGLNNILRSVVLVYDSIEDLHTLRAHYDRILGEAVLSLYSRAKARDWGRKDHEKDFGKLVL